MNILGLVGGLIMLVIFSGYAYIAWFHSELYSKVGRRIRGQFFSKIPLLRQILLIDFFDRRPYIETTYVKIVSLLGMAVCIIGIIVSITGPIVVHRGR